MIDFFGYDWKRDQNILKKEILIFVKNIVLTKNWFVVSNLCEFPKHDTGKWGSGHVYFLLKTKVKSLISELFTYKVNNSLIKYIFCTETTSVSLRRDVSKSIKNPFIKIKKRLAI